jgi:hypothetical protein
MANQLWAGEHEFRATGKGEILLIWYREHGLLANVLTVLFTG